MKQKVQVHLIATDKESNLLIVANSDMEYRGRKKGALELHDSSWATSDGFIAQHLYLTSNEEIKRVIGDLISMNRENLLI